MKIKSLCYHLVHTSRIIARFGSAWLIRCVNDGHELVGGSNDDYTAAKEWVSFFAHDVVFNRYEKRWRQAGFCFDTPLTKFTTWTGSHELDFRAMRNGNALGGNPSGHG